MLEKYYNNKIKYNDYLILIKVGNFYESFENDALIINNIFGYKINKCGSLIKSGFPLSKIDSIIETLKNNCINYVVVDNSEINNSFVNNKYNSFIFDIERIKLALYKIDKIYDSMMNMILDENILNKLQIMEECL